MDAGAAAADAGACPRRRLVRPGFLPRELAAELLLALRALGAVGYRPHVRSLVLRDVAAAEPRLLPALLRARQLVWDTVEEFFGLECGLFVEHTGLVSWREGASIGWHSDDNRDYLAQRHFSAVAYLGTQGAHFTGGAFRFRDGPPPLRVAPEEGLLLAYAAGEANTHCVEPVTGGERDTLTLWFTRDQAASEDRKVLAWLPAKHAGLRGQGLPPSLYQLAPGGPDVRLAELRQQLCVRLEPCCAQPPNPQQQQEQEQQRWAVLATGGAAGGPGEPGRVAFESLQVAALVLQMLRWKCCPHAQGEGQRQLQQRPSCGCFSRADLIERAHMELQRLLEERGGELQRLLPLWRHLGTLVPSPPPPPP